MPGASIDDHYGNLDIYGRVIATLRDAGIDPARATVEDLAGMDHFHSGRLPATRAMAASLGLSPGITVLDAGCGIGGPARYLAATFGCNVIGIDLSPSFIEAAAKLNTLLGLTDRVECRRADITDCGLADASVEAAWSQNVLMNVEDKRSALAEIHRVLRPGGRFALQLIFTERPGELDYPLQWASSADMSFLCTTTELEGMATSVGFQVERWEAEADLAETAATPLIGSPSVIMDFDDWPGVLANCRRAREAGLVAPRACMLVKP